MRYLDANVFCYAALDSGKEGQRARQVLKAMVQGESAITSVLTLHEVAWVIRREADRKSALQETSRILTMANLRVLDVKVRHWVTAMDLMEDHPQLRPRDAVHAAVSLEAGVFSIVSDDDDFDAVPGLERIPL